MKRIRWTRHALEVLAEREVDRDEAERAIHEPAATIPGHGGRTVYLREFSDRALGKQMLLCVVTESEADGIVIVTIYKTSSFGKYFKGDVS